MPEPEVPLDAPSFQEIPDKLYFRIGEVSRLLGVETYVLRYWQTEFPSLSPKKSDTGHRLYRRKDVEQLLRIKELLYGQRFTIEGARQALAHGKVSTLKNAAPSKKPVESKTNPIAAQGSLFGDGLGQSALPEIRRELAAILALLR